MFFISRVIVEEEFKPNQGSINQAVTCIKIHNLHILLLHSTLATISSGIPNLSLVAPKQKSPGCKTRYSQSGIYFSSKSILSIFKVLLIFLGKNLK
jgi:hypothetical protein